MEPGSQANASIAPDQVKSDQRSRGRPTFQSSSGSSSNCGGVARQRDQINEKAWASIQGLVAPMVLISAELFLKLGKLTSYEERRNTAPDQVKSDQSPKVREVCTEEDQVMIPACKQLYQRTPRTGSPKMKKCVEKLFQRPPKNDGSDTGRTKAERKLR